MDVLLGWLKHLFATKPPAAGTALTKEEVGLLLKGAGLDLETIVKSAQANSLALKVKAEDQLSKAGLLKQSALEKYEAAVQAAQRVRDVEVDEAEKLAGVNLQARDFSLKVSIVARKLSGE